MSSSHENETFLRYLATVVLSVKRRSIGFSAPKISCLVWAKKGQLRRWCSIVSFSPHLSHSAGRIFSLPLVMKCLYLWCMSSSSEFCEDCFFSACQSIFTGCSHFLCFGKVGLCFINYPSYLTLPLN